MFCRPLPFLMAPPLIIFNLSSTVAQETMAVCANIVNMVAVSYLQVTEGERAKDDRSSC